MPTRPVSGLMPARSWASSSAYSASASGRESFIEVVLQNDLRRQRMRQRLVRTPAAIHVAQPLRRFDGAQAFVHEIDRQTVAAFQLAGEAPYARAQFVFAAVHVERQAEHEARGLPLGDIAADGCETRIVAFGIDVAERMRHAELRFAHGDADMAQAEIESEDSAVAGV